MNAATPSRQRLTFRQVLAAEQPLMLPCVHDALSAKLAEEAGFTACSIGGFALVGARHAVPDVGLISFAEMRDGIAAILSATNLPILVDGDDGYGDVKNVTRTIQTYETLGAAAIFIEDQRAPKRCGHMAGKDVIPAAAMVAKIRAAAAARSSRETLLFARTDARAVHGLDEALRRAESYLKAGADGVFVEAPETLDEMVRIGAEFRHVPQIANMLEGGGRTPWIEPAELKRMGFSIVAYPTTILFRMVHDLRRSLAHLRAGRAMPTEQAIGFDEFKHLVGFDHWGAIQDTYSS